MQLRSFSGRAGLCILGHLECSTCTDRECQHFVAVFETEGSCLQCCRDLSLLLAATEGLAHLRLAAMSSFLHPQKHKLKRSVNIINFCVSSSLTYAYLQPALVLSWKFENKKSLVLNYWHLVVSNHRGRKEMSQASRWGWCFLEPPWGRGGLLRSWTWQSLASVLWPQTIWGVTGAEILGNVDAFLSSLSLKVHWWFFKKTTCFFFPLLPFSPSFSPSLLPFVPPPLPPSFFGRSPLK